MAAYDDALVVLDRIHESAPPSESSEIASYQVFCLLALGRSDDAQKAIVALVKSDPLYRPSAAISSPRMRAAFDAVRRPLLPQIVQDTYDSAKTAYDRGESLAAVAAFDRVIALLDDPAMAEAANMADLRRLAIGFRDLSKAALAPPVRPAPASAPDPAPVTPPPAAVATPEPPAAARIYGAQDADVVPPTVVSRPTPPWRPRNDVEKALEFRGVLEVVVDEGGDVAGATLVKNVHPAYDRELVARARGWKFRPATRSGTPVKYRMAIEIRLGPPAGR
jgi:protein TonB